MLIPLNKEGLAILACETLEKIESEHSIEKKYYVDKTAVWSNLTEVVKALEKYEKRISRKNSKEKAYGYLLIDLQEFGIFKPTPKGKKELEKILEKIKAVYSDCSIKTHRI